jgi:hypothetical protein
MLKESMKDITVVSKIFNIDITSLSKVWLTVYNTRCKHRGKADAIKFCKELLVCAERYALHQPIEPIPWTKSDDENFPTILKPFRTNLRSRDNLVVVFTLSVFRTIELVRLPISKDISSVTDPCRADDVVIQEIINFIPAWLKRIPALELSKIKYHLTVRNGPNGHALRTSDSDIQALVSSEPPTLLQAIRTVEGKLGDDDPMDQTEVCHKTTDRGPIHSKLTQFPEKAGKTRTIAIVDYYSQRCLRPLHKGLMKLLKQLVSDGTFSHYNVGSYAAKMTKDKSYCYCADLTAATDRFPAIIQRVLLSKLLKDDELSTAMWTLLAERTFTVAWSGELVTYQCGQPMGCYASWPLFALAHHLVVEYAAHKCNVLKPKNLYRLIGDDVLISDRRIAQVYVNLMEALGLTLNKGKTVISTEADEYSAAEVAKQLYLNGTCLTALTPGFIKLLRKPHMFNTCMWTLRTRYGERICPDLVPVLIDSLYVKRKTKRLVWLLVSNPMTGYVKPTDVGYDLFSPWNVVNTTEFIENYQMVLSNLIINQANTQLMQNMHDLMSGSPLVNWTYPQPKAIKRAYKASMNDLRRVLFTVNDLTFSGNIHTLSEVVPFVPSPQTPYLESKELIQKKLSSVLVRLYNLTKNT